MDLTLDIDTENKYQKSPSQEQNNTKINGEMKFLSVISIALQISSIADFFGTM